MGIELDRPVEIGHRPSSVASSAAGHTPLVIGRHKPGIQLDRAVVIGNRLLGTTLFRQGMALLISRVGFGDGIRLCAAGHREGGKAREYGAKCMLNGAWHNDSRLKAYERG